MTETTLYTVVQRVCQVGQVEEDGGDNDGPFSGSNTEHIAGYIGLDDQFNLARDENGKVIFGPWHYVDPWP